MHEPFTAVGFGNWQHGAVITNCYTNHTFCVVYWENDNRVRTHHTNPRGASSRAPVCEWSPEGFRRMVEHAHDALHNFPPSEPDNTVRFRDPMTQTECRVDVRTDTACNLYTDATDSSSNTSVYREEIDAMHNALQNGRPTAAAGDDVIETSVL